MTRTADQRPAAWPASHPASRIAHPASRSTDDQNNVRQETYAYDKLSRVTDVDYGDNEVQSYTFDPMGNRLTKVVNGVSEGYTYNNANMLLTRGTAAYTNDANGNTLTDGAANRTMTWDAQNRMASCTLNGTTSTFTYGADGLRRRMVTGANTTDYLLDGQNVVREIKNGVVNATYLNGPRGPEYKRDQNGNVQWYLYDGLGSVVGLVDESGNVTNSRKYDVYGAPRNAQTGTAHCFVGSLGHTSDSETGLIYMRARYYDPATGRFVSEDPAGDGVNWYTYAANAPTLYVDESGRLFGIPDGKEGAYTAAHMYAAAALLVLRIGARNPLASKAVCTAIAIGFAMLSVVTFAYSFGANTAAELRLVTMAVVTSLYRLITYEVTTAAAAMQQVNGFVLAAMAAVFAWDMAIIGAIVVAEIS